MKNKTNVAFSHNLRRLMGSRNLNDVQLARAAGLSHTAIANYKRGRLPKLDALNKLATYFEVPLDELLHGAEAGRALRIAATVADQHASARVEERQGKFEAAAGELLTWTVRAKKAEEKLGQMQTALAALVADLELEGQKRRRLESGTGRPAKSPRRP